MNKTIILLSSLAFAFSLAGCSDTVKGKGETNQEPVTEVVVGNPNELILNIDGKEEKIESKNHILSDGMDMTIPEGFEINTNQEPETDNIIIGSEEFEEIVFVISKFDTESEYMVEGEKLAKLIANETVEIDDSSVIEFDLSKYPNLKEKYHAFFSAENTEYKRFVFAFAEGTVVTTVMVNLPMSAVSPKSEELIKEMVASLNL